MPGELCARLRVHGDGDRPRDADRRGIRAVVRARHDRDRPHRRALSRVPALAHQGRRRCTGDRRRHHAEPGRCPLSTQPRRRQRDPEGRRQTIIDAATRVIADAGVAGLTHRRVAEVADVPVGSTTYYFKDLDELREAALTDAARMSFDGLDQWADALSDTADLPGTLAR